MNLKFISDIFSDLINLIYPDVCIVCEDKLVKNERLFCTLCLADIPRTNFHLYVDNPVSRIFWGRCKIESATSFFYFKKGSKYRSLLHKLKYKGRNDIGIELGKMFGNDLINSLYNNIDVIIPVPLHPAKLKIRGYNQSEQIANGIGKRMNVPVINNALKRVVNTNTQTKQARFDRWLNVEDIFKYNISSNLLNKNILLVDDIITTGSTVEACVNAIHKEIECKIFAVSLAFTS